MPSRRRRDVHHGRNTNASRAPAQGDRGPHNWVNIRLSSCSTATPAKPTHQYTMTDQDAEDQIAGKDMDDDETSPPTTFSAACGSVAIFGEPSITGPDAPSS